MKILTALGTALVVLALNLAPALARDQYVVDNAHLFSTQAVQAANSRINDFAATTGKEIFVYTTPSLDGATVDSAAERVFAQQQVNGVMIFISKDPKKIGVYPDRASHAFFPAETTSAIRSAIVASFNAGKFDEGLQNGVSLTMSLYRSHLPARTSYNPNAPVVRTQSGGFSMKWIFFFLIVVVAFLVLRALFRALFAPRVAGPTSGPYPMSPPARWVMAPVPDMDTVAGAALAVAAFGAACWAAWEALGSATRSSGSTAILAVILGAPASAAPIPAAAPISPAFNPIPAKSIRVIPAPATGAVAAIAAAGAAEMVAASAAVAAMAGAAGNPLD